MSEIPVKDFDWYLGTAAAQEWEITTRLLLYYTERRQATAKNQQRIVGRRIDNLIEFAAAGNRMGCIVVDPPWSILGSTLPCTPVHVEDLKLLPITELAAARCHVHLWTLPNSCHLTAYDLAEHWGFRVVSEFVWCKTQAGRGNYWRMAHEILLTAVRSEDDRFDYRSLRSWIAAPRGRHSEKPEVVQEMIERASPGPRLELFARNWWRVGSRGVMRSLCPWSIKGSLNWTSRSGKPCHQNRRKTLRSSTVRIVRRLVEIDVPDKIRHRA